jgi:uncharacterized membrane protein
MTSAQAQKHPRYHLLDTLRGLALIFMMLFHLFFDLTYLFGVRLPFFVSPFKDIWQIVNCALFIVLSGFCVSLGKKRLRRALLVFLAGAAVTLATFLFMPSSVVLFGILTMLGSAMLLMIPLRRGMTRIPIFLGLFLSLFLFLVTYKMQGGYLSLFGYRLLTLPDFLYANYFTAYLGFPPLFFASGDYFPLFPWIFLFFVGFFLYRIFEKYGLFHYLVGKDVPLINFCGRHSLWLYIAHQPIIFGTLTLIFYFL